MNVVPDDALSFLNDEGRGASSGSYTRRRRLPWRAWMAGMGFLLMHATIFLVFLAYTGTVRIPGLGWLRWKDDPPKAPMPPKPTLAATPSRPKLRGLDGLPADLPKGGPPVAARPPSPEPMVVAAEAEAVAIPQAADPIGEALGRAREAYGLAIGQVKAVVNEGLARIEERARRDRNRASLERVARERKAFEGTPVAPSSLKKDQSRSARKEIAKAREVLEAAYRIAAEQYQAEGKAGEAETVRQELRAFLEEARPVSRSASTGDGGLIAGVVAEAAILRGEAPPILPPETHWNATRYLINNGLGDGLKQPGAFRIIGRWIYHLDQDYHVGEAWQDADGTLHLVFWGHRKFRGEATLTKDGPGKWSGLNVMPDGSEWRLDLQRR